MREPSSVGFEGNGVVSPPPLPPQTLLERLKDYGQEDAFALWDELSSEERDLLVKDIEVNSFHCFLFFWELRLVVSRSIRCRMALNSPNRSFGIADSASSDPRFRINWITRIVLNFFFFFLMIDYSVLRVAEFRSFENWSDYSMLPSISRYGLMIFIFNRIDIGNHVSFTCMHVDEWWFRAAGGGHWTGAGEQRVDVGG